MVVFGHFYRKNTSILTESLYFIQKQKVSKVYDSKVRKFRKKTLYAPVPMLRLKLLIMTYFIEKPLSTIRQFSKICSFVKIVKTDRFVLAIAALPYLQVESNRSGNTSVLVFVHGGSNRDGMGSMLEGDILAGHGGIIVVTINYRLGIYGESGRLKSSTWALNVKSKESPNIFFSIFVSIICHFLLLRALKVTGY